MLYVRPCIVNLETDYADSVGGQGTIMEGKLKTINNWHLTLDLDSLVFQASGDSDGDSDDDLDVESMSIDQMLDVLPPAELNEFQFR